MKIKKNAFGKIISLLTLILLTAAAALITSCEDEVVDRFVDIPGDTVTVDISGLNHIIAFQVEELGAESVLKAAIKEDSLIVYWPYLVKQPPATISPTILVPEGASVAPASGETVPFVTGTNFTVTAEDQSERQYVLKVAFNQPKPYYDTDLKGGIVFSGENDIRYIEVYEGAEDLGIGFVNIFHIGGDFFITDTARNRIYVTHLKTKKETRLELISTTPSQLQFKIPEDLERGYYSSTFITGERTIRDDSVWLKHPQPELSWPDKVTAAQGEEFEISGLFIRDDITEVQLFTAAPANAEKTALPPFVIVSVTEGLLAGSITLRVPEDFPVGDYAQNLTEVHISTPWANSGDGKFILPRAFEVTAAPAGTE